MSLLRATVRRARDWWELKLLDLDIVADGATEGEMLRELEHALVAEYHLALRAERTPFVDRLIACPIDLERAWEEGDKNLRMLNLPLEVRQALSAVFHKRRISQFHVDPTAALAA